MSREINTKSSVKGIKVVGNRIMVKRDQYIAAKTESGIIIPEQFQDHKTSMCFTGVVVAVGDGIPTANGVVIPFYFEVGDKVILNRDAFQIRNQVMIENDDNEYYRVGENDICAIIED